MTEQQACEPHEKRSTGHKVYIYGGGIAGLTAAHELAIRGFEVHLYEKERALGADGEREPYSLGGMARTQYFVLRDGQTGLDNPYFHYQQPASSRTDLDSLFKVLPRTSINKFMTQGPETSTPVPGVWVKVEPTKASPSSTGGWQEPQPPFDVEQGFKERFDLAIEKFREVYRQSRPTSNPIGLEFPEPLPEILVQAFVDPSLLALEASVGEKSYREIAKDRAKSIADSIVVRLKDGLTGTPLEHRVKAYRIGQEDDYLPAHEALGLPPAGVDWVRIILYRTVLPGEHGYRFFPSFYRHVFDSMRRTPRYDAGGQPTSGTVYDNLVSLPRIGILSERAAPFIVNWEPLPKADTFSRVERNLINLRTLDVTSQDITQFSLRILRYMTTCPERRAQELENTSWWDYLEGYNPKTGTRLYRYSPSFAHTLKSSSRILAALDGERGDARTCGNTYVQLLTEALVPTVRSISTLNGPTSDAWFTHWRAHLKRLGVSFHHGELRGLHVDSTGSVTARVCHAPGQSGADTPEPPCKEEIHPTPRDVSDKLRVYLLVATDLVSARAVTASLKPPVGVAIQLARYVDMRPDRPGELGTEERDPTTKMGGGEWDRLQTIAGIQFFYTSHINISDGYLYFVDSQWGLSAIASHIVWRDPPIERLSRYQSILSVDIGEWRKGKPKAWDVSPAELAKQVYEQIRNSLKPQRAGEPDENFVLPDPNWVHIDENLVFGKDGDAASSRLKLERNKTPYLVPTVGDWKWRPGPEPWNPTRRGAQQRGTTPLIKELWKEEELWQASHGGYWVHWSKLVFAGTYTRTFTRLTTMESANESARHAVNAILDHCIARDMAEAERLRGRTRGKLQEDEDFFSPTSHGDYCRIWDPERNELPDVAALQRLDEHNFRHGLSHPWDVLGVERLTSLRSYLPGGGAGDSIGRLVEVVRMLGDKVGLQDTGGMLGVLDQIRMLLGAAKSRSP